MKLSNEIKVSSFTDLVPIINAYEKQTRQVYNSCNIQGNWLSYIFMLSDTRYVKVTKFPNDYMYEIGNIRDMEQGKAVFDTLCTNKTVIDICDLFYMGLKNTKRNDSILSSLGYKIIL